MINNKPAAPPPSQNTSTKQVSKPKNHGAATLKVALTAASVVATVGGWGLISATAPEMKAEFGGGAVAQVAPTATPMPRASNTPAPSNTPQASAAQNRAQPSVVATPTPRATVRPQATPLPQARPTVQPRPRTRSSR